MSARDDRDKALAQVEANGLGWAQLALDYIRDLPLGYEGTGEQIRLELTKRGLPAPHHHNAWGSLCNKAAKDGCLRDTGRTAQMKGSRSHARKTGVWIRADGPPLPRKSPVRRTSADAEPPTSRTVPAPAKQLDLL